MSEQGSSIAAKVRDERGDLAPDLIMATKGGGKEEAQPGSILLVIHNFVARSADELSLAKGDRIELIERDDDFGDGWYLGRHMTNNQTGLFPEGMSALT